MVVPDYVISLFKCAIELIDAEPNVGEKLLELRMDLEAKSIFTIYIFTRYGLCTLLSSELVTKRYSKLSEYVLLFLLVFPNYYMVEANSIIYMQY